MQGRLLPKYRGRYQAHPVGYWQDEFRRARDLGLSCIEFILDFEGMESNPLMTNEGIEEIQAVVSATGVGVRTVCADYFMEAPLHHADPMVARDSLDVLRRLIEAGRRLGLTDVVIPCVDQSRIADDAAMSRFVIRLMQAIDAAESASVNLCLETDLAPAPFAELLGRFGSTRVTVNYDTGNSASLGYDPVEELRLYGDRITDIHIKDRVRNGGSVILGAGAAEFGRFLSALRPLNFQGPFILQAYRDDEGFDVFRHQLEWLRALLSVELR